MMPRPKSPSRSKSRISTKSIKFCHYKNGMFMGQMKCFQRQGKGMVFLDSGEVALATYEKDKLQGQTLLISKNNILYSLIYDHDNLLELVAQSRDKMVYIKFKYGTPEGPATIIDFQKEEIFYISYKQGRIIKKAMEQDSIFLNRVFDHDNLSAIIPVSHTKLLNFQFQFPFLEVMRKHSFTTIGFHKEGSLNGLGFVLFKDADKEKSFYELLEKGYYKESLLNGIGEKRYQNGNLYIGQFKNNIFQGKGLLFNTLKNNWVKGIFKDGNLVDMIEYSNEGDSNSPKIIQMLSTLHKKKSSWVNSQLKFHSEIKFNAFLDKQIKNLYECKQGDILEYQQRKEIVLKRIQNNFVPDNAHTDIVRKSSLIRWENSMQSNADSKKRRFSPMSTQKQSISIINQSPIKSVLKSKSKSQNAKTEKPELFKIKPNFKSPQKANKQKQQKQIQLSQQRQKWKNNTNEIPINIYTFQQSSQSPRFQPSQSKAISNIHRFHFSMNRQQSQPAQLQSKRSISASRRHKIFENSPSRVVSSSRLGFPSPSKSSIRQSHKNYEDSSVSDVLQQIKYPVRKSNKMVKSRVFEAKTHEQDSLPSFKYSRFKPQQESQYKYSKYSDKSRMS